MNKTMTMIQKVKLEKGWLKLKPEVKYHSDNWPVGFLPRYKNAKTFVWYLPFVHLVIHENRVVEITLFDRFHTKDALNYDFRLIAYNPNKDLYIFGEDVVKFIDDSEQYQSDWHTYDFQEEYNQVMRFFIKYTDFKPIQVNPYADIIN